MKFTLLRHAAITRPQLRLPAPPNFAIGALLFYQLDMNNVISMSKILSQTGDSLELQDYAHKTTCYG